MSHDGSERIDVVEASLPRLPEFGVIDVLRSELLKSSLHYSSSITEIVDLCLSRLRLLLPFDVLSVYMLNRLGQLDRVGAALMDNQPPPEVGPLPPEKWIDVLPGWTPGSRHNDLFVTDAIPETDPLAGWLRGAVGEIKGVVRIPLNGTSQTFGVLEAVNPGFRATQWGPEIEFRRDVRRLVFIGSALASAITIWRARTEMLAVAEVMTSLAGAELHAGADEEEISNAFTRALGVGLEHLQAYRAAILRIENPSDSLSILAKAKNADLSWSGWMDRELRSGRFLAETVLEKLGPVTVESIESSPALFANFEWLRSAGMRSAACVPMQITDTTLGTLTVFTGFRYSFSELDLRLLGAIANGFAMFWQRLQIHRRLVIAEQSSTQSQMRRFFSLLHLNYAWK